MPAPQRGHSVPQSQLPQGSSRSPRQVTPAHAPATQVGSDSRIKLQFDPLTHRLRVQHPSIEGIPLRSAADTLVDVFLSLPPTSPDLSDAWASRCRRVSAV
jgi:hypothetical protein